MKLRLHHLRWLAVMASSVLFVYVVARAHPKVILDKMRLLGWVFAFLVVLSGVRSLLRALAWSYCVRTDGVHPHGLDLFGPRLVADALTDSVPAGPLFGETSRVVSITRFIPAQAGASSVLIENLIFSLAAVSFILSGVALVLLTFTTPQAFRWLGGTLVVSFVGVVLMACWMVRRRIPLLGWMLDGLRRAGLRWGFLERHQSQVRAIERDVYDFFLAHKRLFLFVFAIEFATNFTGVGEAYLVLKITAAHASLFTSYLAEATCRAVQLTVPFIPFGLGVQEGAAAATLQALGYAASEGVSLAIIRKMRTLFWTALGLLLAARYVVPQSTRREHSAP